MISLEIKATIFILLKDRKILNYHAIEGFYLVLVIYHYRFPRNYIHKTRVERVLDNIGFHPEYCKIPYTSLIGDTIEVLKNLVVVSKYTKPGTSGKIHILMK